MTNKFGSKGPAMVLSLGPMPDAVRVVVQRLVATARQDRPEPDDRLGYCLTAGPGGASYIDFDGSVWNWFCDLDGIGEIIEFVPDGPMKVGLVAIAAERVPELGREKGTFMGHSCFKHDPKT